MALDSFFTKMALRAALNMGEYLNAAETYMRLALKAQSQCRTHWKRWRKSRLRAVAFLHNCIPESMLNGDIKDFDIFLEERRKLMSLKIKTRFESL